MNCDINATLNEREKDYGSFSEFSKKYCAVTNVLNPYELPEIQCVAANMIIMKLCRAFNGDANKADTWHDIAGYATLVEKELNGGS